MASKKSRLSIVSADSYTKQYKTDSYAGLIVEALKAADIYKPEKDPAIYMLATLLELYQKTREEIDKKGLTVEDSTKTTLKTKANPAVAMNLSYAKAIQQYLQQLGLSAAITARAGGSAGGSDDGDSDNPLDELRRTIEGNRSPVVLKLRNIG